tara:strand:- start:247 stop:771 length:525 start_codon:yes stop_codon:yes gene_type:complete
MSYKIKKSTRETTVNNYINEDGEILDTVTDVKRQTILVPDKDSFAMAFSSVIGLMAGLDKMSINLIMWCSQNCVINQNIINLGKAYRSAICKEFKVSDQTIKNSIGVLSKKGILISIGTATYKVHPKYFWRGDMGERNRSLQYILTIEYNAKVDSDKKIKGGDTLRNVGEELNK